MSQIPDGAGPGRRTVLKRTALIGGTMVWSTPVVQSIAAPALAVGGSPATQPDGEGGPSYVIVFVRRGGTYHQFKFDRDDTNGRYAMTCLGSGVKGLSGDVKKDAVCYAGYLSARGSHRYSASCDDSLIEGYGPASSTLRVDLAAGCTLVGWFLHDGTCRKDVTPGNGKCRWSKDRNATVDPVGPSVPTPDGGAFEFAKCA
jgi:hypothetical protein